MKKILGIAAVILSYAVPAQACDPARALALNMYHEARDQGFDGMLLVAEVTMNRVEHDKFPDTICSVVYQGRKDKNGNMIRHKCQFSWYCDGRSDKPKNKVVWSATLQLAKDILDGKIELLNSGATHYLNPEKVDRMPRWTQVYELVGMWDDHVFYRVGDQL